MNNNPLLEDDDDVEISVDACKLTDNQELFEKIRFLQSHAEVLKGAVRILVEAVECGDIQKRETLSQLYLIEEASERLYKKTGSLESYFLN